MRTLSIYNLAILTAHILEQNIIMADKSHRFPLHDELNKLLNLPPEAEVNPFSDAFDWQEFMDMTCSLMNVELEDYDGKELYNYRCIVGSNWVSRLGTVAVEENERDSLIRTLPNYNWGIEFEKIDTIHQVAEEFIVQSVEDDEINEIVIS